MLADAIEVHHPNRAFLRKFLGPSEPITEAVVEDEQRASLMQGGARQSQCARGFSSLVVSLAAVRIPVIMIICSGRS